MLWWLLLLIPCSRFPFDNIPTCHKNLQIQNDLSFCISFFLYVSLFLSRTHKNHQKKLCLIHLLPFLSLSHFYIAQYWSTTCGLAGKFNCQRLSNERGREREREREREGEAEGGRERPRETWGENKRADTVIVMMQKPLKREWGGSVWRSLWNDVFSWRSIQIDFSKLKIYVQDRSYLWNINMNSTNGFVGKTLKYFNWLQVCRWWLRAVVFS